MTSKPTECCVWQRLRVLNISLVPSNTINNFLICRQSSFDLYGNKVQLYALRYKLIHFSQLNGLIEIQKTSKRLTSKTLGKLSKLVSYCHASRVLISFVLLLLVVLSNKLYKMDQKRDSNTYSLCLLPIPNTYKLVKTIYR